MGTVQPSMNGQVVRIEGMVGDRYITEVLGQSVDNLMTHSREGMNGGGLRQVTSTGITWGSDFFLMNVGNNSLAPSGFFNVTLPPDGTVIQKYSGGLAATVAGGYVPLGDWEALYYEVPAGQANYSVPANWRIVSYSVTATFEVPVTWILICSRNGQDKTVRWGDGVKQDWWHTATLQNTWVNYGSPYDLFGFKLTDGGDKVQLRGLIKLGTGTIATLSAGYAPKAQKMFVCQANLGAVRIDIYTSGIIAVTGAYYPSGATNGYLSLEEVSFSRT